MTRPGAHALVFYGKSLILVRKSRGPFIGMIDLPGGKIEHGESYRNALRRVLTEELGIETISEPHLFDVFTRIKNFQEWKTIHSVQNVAIVSTCTIHEMPVLSGGTGDTDDNDVSEAVFINPNDYRKCPLSPLCREVVENLVWKNSFL